jgi:CRP-like cAMP-binding protein
MADPRLLRTSRELFLSALGGARNDVETWVIDRMTSRLEEEEVPAGTRIFAAGEEVEFIYLMHEGRLRMVRENGAPWTFVGRWVIGAFDAVLDRPHTRTAVALTNLSLMRVRADHWIEVLEESFELSRGVVANLVRASAALESRLWRSRPQPALQAGATREGAPVAGERPLEVDASSQALLGYVASSAVSRPVGPLSFVDRLAILTDVAILRAAGIQVLADVAGLMQEVSFEPGELIHERGENGGRFFVVIEGEVVADRSDPELSVRFGPGRVVCGVAGLGEPAQAWRARAVERTRALSMRLEDWYDLMEEHFDLVRSALRALALRRESILDELAADAGDLLLQ